MINWKDPKSHITPYFTVGEVLTLHAWNRLATEADGADFNKLLMLCHKMEEVRGFLGCPINVHCMFRSVAYNQSQGIKPPQDVHSFSIACDFDCLPSLSIEALKQKLESMLENLEIRMERGTLSWVHIDLRAPGASGRYFTP